MTWRWVLVVLLSGCSGDVRRVAGGVAWVVGDAVDRLVHEAKYRAAFASAHRECLPSTVRGADGNGSGTCTTTRGCLRQVTCFLDCDVRETCP